MVMRSKKTRISVGLSKSMLRDLEAISAETHLSVSWLGERALIEFLDRRRGGTLQLPLALSDQRQAS